MIHFRLSPRQQAENMRRSAGLMMSACNLGVKTFSSFELNGGGNKRCESLDWPGYLIPSGCRDGSMQGKALWQRGVLRPALAGSDEALLHFLCIDFSPDPRALGTQKGSKRLGAKSVYRLTISSLTFDPCFYVITWGGGTAVLFCSVHVAFPLRLTGPARFASRWAERLSQQAILPPFNVFFSFVVVLHW